jgi:hypothetical protein
MRCPFIKLFSFVTEAPAKFKKGCFPGKPFQPSPIFAGKIDLYYKHMTIVNDDSMSLVSEAPNVLMILES